MNAYRLRLSVLSGHLIHIRPGEVHRPWRPCSQAAQQLRNGIGLEWSSPISSLRPLACSAAIGSHTGVSSVNIPAETSFKVHRITGDGSCMFRAVVQGLAQAVSGKPVSTASEGEAAHSLRLAVVEELKRNRDDIEAFIPGIIEGNQTFESYLQTMSQPGAWGGEPEMVMASNVIKRPIRVWRSLRRSLEPIVTYGEGIGGDAVNLLWSGSHYDLLVPDRQTR